jgi:hypothetical protein
MIEALINFLPMKESKQNAIAGVGALDYSIPERKKLALKSRQWECELCGPIRNILKIEEEIEKKQENIEEKKIDEKPTNKNKIEQNDNHDETIVKREEEKEEREPENFQIDQIVYPKGENQLENKINAIKQMEKILNEKSSKINEKTENFEEIKQNDSEIELPLNFEKSINLTKFPIF